VAWNLVFVVMKVPLPEYCGVASGIGDPGPGGGC
jgi:hypothetical protein